MKEENLEEVEVEEAEVQEVDHLFQAFQAIAALAIVATEAITTMAAIITIPTNPTLLFMFTRILTLDGMVVTVATGIINPAIIATMLITMLLMPITVSARHVAETTHAPFFLMPTWAINHCPMILPLIILYLMEVVHMFHLPTRKHTLWDTMVTGRLKSV